MTQLEEIRAQMTEKVNEAAIAMNSSGALEQDQELARIYFKMYSHGLEMIDELIAEQDY